MSSFKKWQLICVLAGGMALLSPNAGLATPSDASATLTGGIVFVPEVSETDKALRLGMFGPRVEKMQQQLIEYGFLDAAADGYFGAATELSLKMFQRQTGLDDDGIAGRATLAKLSSYKAAAEDSAEQASGNAQPVLRQGDSGEQVSYLQGYLTNAGYLRGGIDGSFGAATHTALAAFQRDNGLEPDGIAGAATIAALRNARPAASRSSRQLVMTATAYSAFDAGNNQYTHRGSFLCKGIAAVDPAVIPLGSRLYISGYGYAVADDTGGAISGSRIDLAFNSNAEALDFGVRQVEVYILD